MDFSLRCNSLKCRAQLTDRAVVTTCSHIFCLPCSQTLQGLAQPNASERICPACETQLLNPDDAVVTQLNPSEDYKTSVLSGLSPSVIMECAGRGLGFYSYQTSQEIIYQEFLAKSLTDKYSTLSTQMDSIINQANNEINALQEKLSAMHVEQKTLEQKNFKLQENYRNKAKEHQQVSKLYNKLKQQQVAGGLELAAEHDAEDTLQGAGHQGGLIHSRAGSHGSGASGRLRQTSFGAWEQQQYGGDRGGIHGGRNNASRVAAAPSGHRTRLPAAPLYASRSGPINSVSGDGLRQGTPYRQPLQNMDPNVFGNNHDGFVHGGMSAGVKIGRQHGGTVGQNGVGIGRLGRVGGIGMR